MLGSGRRNSVAALALWLSDRGRRVPRGGTDTSPVCVPAGEACSVVFLAPGTSVSFSTHRALGPVRLERSGGSVSRDVWVGVGSAHVAGVGHVDSETFSASWGPDASRAVAPARREASSWRDGVRVLLVARLGDAGCSRAPAVRGTGTPRGGQGRDGEGCVERVSLEHHVLSGSDFGTASGQNVRSGVVRPEEGHERTCLRPAWSILATNFRTVGLVVSLTPGGVSAGPSSWSSGSPQSWGGAGEGI